MLFQKEMNLLPKPFIREINLMKISSLLILFF